jgi:hypothetical protein
LDTSAQDRSCQDGGVSHAKTNTTDELQEATSVSEVPSRDGSCNDQCQASCQTIARGVWCKRQVALHIRKVLSGSQRQSASKRIALFKSFDKLWDVLDRNGDGFVSFQELHWLVEDVGESLKEVISGQKNLMVVVRDLNFVLSIALLAPVALIYGTFHDFFLHCA